MIPKNEMQIKYHVLIISQVQSSIKIGQKGLFDFKFEINFILLKQIKTAKYLTTFDLNFLVDVA